MYLVLSHSKQHLKRKRWISGERKLRKTRQYYFGYTGGQGLEVVIHKV
jgi:hypothetical protein